MNRVFKARPSALGKIMSNAKKEGELSATCISYLNDWYSDDFDDIDSKYMRKGLIQEDRCIDFAAERLGYGILEKNQNVYENEYLIGTPDVVQETFVLDTKCPWSFKTLIDASNKLNKDYEWQLRGYMMLCNVHNSTLFYGLLDTPSEANYGVKVIWENLPIDERWVAYNFERDMEIEQQIINKVIKCREYLKELEVDSKKKLGIINQIK